MKLKSTIALLSLSIFIWGCSDDTGSESSASSTGDISGLPKATAPVSSSSSSSMSSLAASTGLALKNWEDSTKWTSSESRAMCETGLVVKDAIKEAMNPDKILCYIGSVSKAGKFSGTLKTDGTYNYFKLTNMPGLGSFEPKIKVKIVKTGSSITQFEMFSCFSGTNASPVQTEYINQSISQGSASITTIYAGSESGNTYGSKTSVTGTVDANYNWLTKSLTIDRAWDGTANGYGSNGQSVEISQEADYLTISGYNKGTFQRDMFDNAFYTAIQLLNASTPKNLALGDGSAKYNFSYKYDSDDDGDWADESGGNVFTDSGTASWNGDTRQNIGTASDGDYYSLVNSESAPAVGSIPTVTFDSSSNQDWDCAAPSGESFAEADLADSETASTTLGTLMAACESSYGFNQENSDGYVCDQPQ